MEHSKEVTIDTGDIITPKNTPDFTVGETVRVEESDAHSAKYMLIEKAQKQTVIGIILIAVSAFLLLLFTFDKTFLEYLFSQETKIMIFTCVILSLPSVFFAIPGMILLRKGIRFKKAAESGSISFYRFDVTDKGVVHGEETTTHYVYFGGVRCNVDDYEYARAKKLMPVFCAVVRYGENDYFDFFGTTFFGGKYNSQ